MSEPRYYSFRCLSPYRGTVQVVEMQGFRAVSGNGRDWQVQLSEKRDSSLNGKRFGRLLRKTAWGSWSSEKSNELVETERTRPFIDAIRNHPALPFPLADRMELWLLDSSNMPLMLISSKLHGERVPPKLDDVSWWTGVIQDSTFVAPSLKQDTSPTSGKIFMKHDEVLRRCIRVALGARPAAQWFYRDESGNGQGFGGCNVDTQMEGRRLNTADFPELIISERGWGNEREKQLVCEYHNWHAANLLTHWGLSDATRDRLERAAQRQASRLYYYRHVLPGVINEDLVKTVFVEARIRGVQPA